MIQCPNCGGNLKFDIASQQLACEFCGSHFEPYKFDDKEEDAVKDEMFDVTIFTCPECGGEILSTDNAAAGFCSFCGASTILYDRISREKRPKYIIPFTKTKEDCKNAYMKMMRYAIFAPDELKDKQYIEGFRGIYMPYWAYNVTQKGNIQLKAKNSHRQGDYIVNMHYLLGGDIDAYYKGLYYDASSSFADSISEKLAPYDVKDVKEFTPGFLSGFYADVPDVDKEVYRENAEEKAFMESFEKVAKTSQFSSYTIEADNESSRSPVTMHTSTETIDGAMFPVWFLSYRNGDRVAYATVNGQTGKVVADLPIAPKKYLIGSLILAVPIFLLFNLFFTLQPETILCLASFIALASIIIYEVEISQTVKKEEGRDDKGVLAKKFGDVYNQMYERYNKKKRRIIKKDIKPQLEKAGEILIYIVIFGYLWIPLFQVLMSTTLGRPAICIISAIGTFIASEIGYQNYVQLKEKKKIPVFAYSIIATVVAFLIILINPVSEMFYYGGAIFSLVAVFLTILEIIRYYNILATRKLPQFEKQGGDNRA